MTKPHARVFPPRSRIDEWTVVKQIGHGGYGVIYEVSGLGSSDSCYAMKVEPLSVRNSGIKQEIQVLQHLQGSPYFPRLVTHGTTSEVNYYVMELLGPSVSSIGKALHGEAYSHLTATVIAKYSLKCLKELHARGIVHRDIKPANFLFREHKEHMMCLIDYGLACWYIDKATGKHIQPDGYTGFTGTYSFASVRAHEGQSLTRRDDVISWLYSIVEIVERKLPWPGSANKEQTYQMKKQISAAQLCRSLPKQFITIYKHISKLEFSDAPDYDRYDELLDEAIAELGGSTVPFDWETQTISFALMDLTDIQMPRNGRKGRLSMCVDSPQLNDEDPAKREAPAVKKASTAPVRKKKVIEDDPICGCNVA